MMVPPTIPGLPSVKLWPLLSVVHASVEGIKQSGSDGQTKLRPLRRTLA